ncbi:MAG TPA: YfiR family protein [Candidatus Acidoferrales bacterium]|nr:YfiR family protein [Candidatus Acidoferrales bacterium]
MTASQFTVRIVCSIVAFASLFAVSIRRAEPVQLPGADNYESQSQYLLTFAEFIDWPALTVKQSVLPTINFCVLGHDPYGDSLDKAVLGHLVGERRTEVTRAHRLVDLGVCDVLFISSSEEKHEVAILKKLQKQDVLTVGDTSNFAAHGGIIQFVWEQNHLDFLINVDAAERAHLKINASLLALAQIVHDEPVKTASGNVH